MAARGEPSQVLAVLPARLASTRLPEKVLLAETGLPLFVHTARAVARARRVTRIVVATDDERVQGAAQIHGIEARLTDPRHPSGTDRVHEVARALAGEVPGGFEVVLNVQADEPEVEPSELDALIGAFEDPAVEAATLAAAITDPAELASTSVVKVVRDRRQDALYFSRAPLPSRAHARPDASAHPLALRHVGVYAFRPAALADFCALPPSPLECAENLEQLRWLEAGRRMRVLDARRAPRGIDTEEDYRAFVTRMGASPREAQR